MIQFLSQINENTFISFDWFFFNILLFFQRMIHIIEEKKSLKLQKIDVLQK